MTLSHSLGGRPIFGGPRRELLEYLGAHPDRAEPLEARARGVPNLDSVPAAVRALVAADLDAQAARGRPEETPGLERRHGRLRHSDGIEAFTDEPLSVARSAAALLETRAALPGIFGGRPTLDSDTGKCENGEHGTEATQA